MDKTCIKCKLILPVEEFTPRGKYKDGRDRYYSQCRSCQRICGIEKLRKKGVNPRYNPYREDNTKKCSACQEYLPLSEFSPRSNRVGSYQPRCKNCQNAKNKERYIPKPSYTRLPSHPDGTKKCKDCERTLPLSEFYKRGKRKDSYGTKCKECLKRHFEPYLNNRKPFRTTKEKERAANLKRLYKITIKDYEALLKEQNNLCAVCGGPALGKGRYHIDHDHKTGKVRGLLCHKCNVALGMVQDNIEHLYWLIDYLVSTN